MNALSFVYMINEKKKKCFNFNLQNIFWQGNESMVGTFWRSKLSRAYLGPSKLVSYLEKKNRQKRESLFKTSCENQFFIFCCNSKTNNLIAP